MATSPGGCQSSAEEVSTATTATARQQHGLADDQHCRSRRHLVTLCSRTRSAQAAAFERPPQLDDGARIAQARAGRLLEALAGGGAACSRARAGRARSPRSASPERDTSAACPRAPCRARRAEPDGARRTRRRAPRRRGSPGGSTGRRARRRPARRTPARSAARGWRGRTRSGSASSRAAAAKPTVTPGGASGTRGAIPATSWSSAMNIVPSASAARWLAPRARNGTYSRSGSSPKVALSRRSSSGSSVPVSSANTNASRRCCSSRACSSSTSRCAAATTSITASAQRHSVSLNASTVATSAPCARASSPNRDHTAVIEIR